MGPLDGITVLDLIPIPRAISPANCWQASAPM